MKELKALANLKKGVGVGGDFFVSEGGGWKIY